MNRRQVLKFATIGGPAFLLCHSLLHQGASAGTIQKTTPKTYPEKKTTPQSVNFTVNKDLCIQCGTCARACPKFLIQLKQYPVLRDEDQCMRCQHCLAVCPAGALSILGYDPKSSPVVDGRLPDLRAMNTLVKSRRSIRQYRDENLDVQLIRDLLDTASYAPTGRNSRQVLFTVVDDKTVMRALRDDVMEQLCRAVTHKTLPNHPKASIFGIVSNLWQARQIDLIFKGAPHMVITSAPRQTPHPKEDTLIALSYFQLLAQSIGIGTLWNSLAKTVLTDIFPNIGIKMGIPENHHVGFAMLFGKPAIEYHRTIQRGPAKTNHVNWKV